MSINLETLSNIYKALGDELSRGIFENRMMYSISRGDFKWLRNVILHNKRVKIFISELEQYSKINKIVIFGAGESGKRIKRILGDIPIKYFVDSNVDNKEQNSLSGVPVISYENFVRNYQGEYIIISSRVYRNEMLEQLQKDGIREHIINFGEIRENLMQDQYFDLECLQRTGQKEIFADIGCYDAASSINFVKWCKGPCFVYAFEPDTKRVKECKRNFENNKIDYKLITKGIWKENTVLHFLVGDNVVSRVSEKGNEDVEVTTLDKVLGDKEITFIKMDIEGSELEALIGAEHVIKKNRPKLAICVYHKFEDIFEIPAIILRFYPNYKLYLRHYSIANSETVLYALPDDYHKGASNKCL